MAGKHGTINLFKLTQKICQNIGIFPLESKQKCQRITANYWFIPVCLVQLLISSAAYLLMEAYSMIEYGMVFYSCTTILFCIFLYLIFAWQTENILQYIKNYEQFIGRRVHSTLVYKNTNEKIEQFTELFAYALFITAIILMLLPLLYAIINYYILDKGKESFFLFFPTWWPFDWKTPLGYFVTWLGEFVGFEANIIIAVPCFNIIVGSSWLFMVIADDITNDVAAFNSRVRMLKLEDKVGDRAKLTKCFCEIIQNYSDAKQLIIDFNELNKYLLFTFFAWDMVNIPCLLVVLQYQLGSDDSTLFEIMILSLTIQWLFAANLLVCEPGERVSGQFQKFDAEFRRCEWNKLSMAMKRLYLIFLSDTQRPKNIRTYGGILCTRDTFKKITTTGFSYFMTLRRFRT